MNAAKKQKCCLHLVQLLLNNGTEFTCAFMIELVELLTMEKMTSLLTTCKQLFKAEEITLYYAPKLWNSPDEVRKMLLAMTETNESRWRLSWVDTTRVEELMLGVNQRSDTVKNIIVTDLRVVRLFDNVEQFPQLTSINLKYCDKITDASVINIAKRCSQLRTMLFAYCLNVTEDSLDVLQQEHPVLETDYST